MTDLERLCRKYGEITHRQNGKVYLLTWDYEAEEMKRLELNPRKTKSDWIEKFLTKIEKTRKGESMSKSLVELENERLAWSLDTFKEATSVSSLLKAQEEIKEIQYNIENGIKDPEEYADAIMCIFDSAGRDGISVKEIVEAFDKKLEKNKSRKWVKNPDNTYSHVKI